MSLDAQAVFAADQALLVVFIFFKVKFISFCHCLKQNELFYYFIAVSMKVCKYEGMKERYVGMKVCKYEGM